MAHTRFLASDSCVIVHTVCDGLTNDDVFSCQIFINLFLVVRSANKFMIVVDVAACPT